MPDITEIIGVDEKYTIVAEVAPDKSTGSISQGKDLLVGAAIGRVSGRVADQKKAIINYIKSKPIVTPAKTIVVTRYLRDNSKLLLAVEALNNPRNLIDSLVASGKKLTPDESLTTIVSKDLKKEIPFSETSNNKDIRRKITLSSPTFYSPTSQNNISRKDFSRKEKLLEISRRQKDTQITETYKVLEKTNRTLEKTNRDFMALKTSIQTQYISLIKHNSIVSRYQNQIIRLKKIASGMETFMDEYSPNVGRNELARSRERMQNKIIREKEIAFSQRRAQTELTFEQKFSQATGTTGREMIKSTPMEPLFEKPDRGAQLFNRMSMKGRR